MIVVFRVGFGGGVTHGHVTFQNFRKEPLHGAGVPREGRLPDHFAVTDKDTVVLGKMTLDARFEGRSNLGVRNPQTAESLTESGRDREVPGKKK